MAEPLRVSAVKTPQARNDDTAVIMPGGRDIVQTFESNASPHMTSRVSSKGVFVALVLFGGVVMLTLR